MFTWEIVAADLNAVKMQARVRGVDSPRPTPYHHGDLRASLVEGAYQQLRAHGAEGVSLRSVAAAAGVSPSAAYHHFPDKTALLLAVGDRASEEFDASARAAWASVPGDDDAAVIARFEALGEAYIDFAAAEPHLFRHKFGPLVAAAAFGTDGKGEANGEGPQPIDPDGAFGLLLRALHDLAARGLLRGGDAVGADLLAWSTVHGFAVLAMDGWMAPEARPALFAAIHRVFIEGGPPAGPPVSPRP